MEKANQDELLTYQGFIAGNKEYFKKLDKNGFFKDCTIEGLTEKTKNIYNIVYTLDKSDNGFESSKERFSGLIREFLEFVVEEKKKDFLEEIRVLVLAIFCHRIGKTSINNDKLIDTYEKLINHIKKNGTVKFNNHRDKPTYDALNGILEDIKNKLPKSQTNIFKIISFIKNMFLKSFSEVVEGKKYLKICMTILILGGTLPFILFGGFDYSSNLHSLLASLCMLISSMITFRKFYQNMLGFGPSKENESNDEYLLSYAFGALNLLSLLIIASIFISCSLNISITTCNIVLFFLVEETIGYVIEHCPSMNDTKKNIIQLVVSGLLLVGLLLSAFSPYLKLKALMMIVAIPLVLYYHFFLIDSTNESDKKDIDYEKLIKAVAIMLIFLAAAMLCVGLISSLIYMPISKILPSKEVLPKKAIDVAMKVRE